MTMKMKKNWAFWHLSLACAVFVLVSVPVCASTIIGSDQHTEGNASDWALEPGPATLSDTADAVVGALALKYNIPTDAAGVMTLTFDPTDLSGFTAITLHAKVSAFAQTWAQSQIELLDVLGNRRFMYFRFAQDLVPIYQQVTIPMAGLGDVGAFDITKVNRFQIRAIAPNTTVDLFIDGLGTVPVPEPSSVVLVLLGGACSFLAFIRRIRDTRAAC